MRVSLNTKSFEQQLNNITEYSFGFLEGIGRGKNIFLSNLGKDVIHVLGDYIDTNARMSPQAMHHVYEWYKVGSPAARLFDLDYTVSNLGLSMKSTFRQSKTLSQGSSEPFYNKARIMENGIPITIKPKKNSVLVFDDNGETVFTKKPIDIKNPGGIKVHGSFESTFDSFFKYYFSQSFLKASGLSNYIQNPIIYKKDFARGAKLGKSQGINTGYTWITNAKIGVQ